VLLGAYLTNVIPLDTIRVFAALAFIVFGLWSLRVDNEEEASTSYRFGPVLTVALAFFVGELGDKTQLTAITLSSKAELPLFVLLGTVAGMILTSAAGVFVGTKLGKRVPELALKVVSSIIFVAFGLAGLREATQMEYFTAAGPAIFVIVLLSIHVYLIKRAHKKSKYEDTPFKRKAGELYINTNKIQKSLESICKNNKSCSNCKNDSCTIQLLNKHLLEAQKTDSFVPEKEWKIPLCDRVKMDISKVKESLRVTIDTCLECPRHQHNCVGNQTRKVLETLYFGKRLPYAGEREAYYRLVKKLDPNFFER
jgi:putative Ca2+/H+ antiporter (TMEM165/GDT1 family)